MPWCIVTYVSGLLRDQVINQGFNVFIVVSWWDNHWHDPLGWCHLFSTLGYETDKDFLRDTCRHILQLLGKNAKPIVRKAHLRQNKWIVHVYLRLETGWAPIEKQQINQTDKLIHWSWFFGYGKASCSTAMANADDFSFVWEIYPIPGRYETTPTTAINAKPPTRTTKTPTSQNQEEVAEPNLFWFLWLF